MGQCGTNIEYDVPIQEIMNITRSGKTGKFCVTCLDPDRNEMKIWMTFPQFSAFRAQCILPCNAGIYAHCGVSGFLFTVFGNRIPMSDYRMAACFNMTKGKLVFPIPRPLPVPNHVEIDDDLRDKHSY